MLLRESWSSYRPNHAFGPGSRDFEAERLSGGISLALTEERLERHADVQRESREVVDFFECSRHVRYLLWTLAVIGGWPKFSKGWRLTLIKARVARGAGAEELEVLWAKRGGDPMQLGSPGIGTGGAAGSQIGGRGGRL